MPFIRCKTPLPLLGLAGTCIRSPSLYRVLLECPSFCAARFCLSFAVGNRGKAESRLEDSISGDGGPRGIGIVALRDGPLGLPKGDRGVIGEALLEGDRLAGVSWSCGM